MLVFGLADGKVRAGNLKTNKSQTLATTNSYVVSLAPRLGKCSRMYGGCMLSVLFFFFLERAVLLLTYFVVWYCV